MKSAAPAILISPSTERKGAEFHDYSLSLSDAYPRAVQAAGGVPWILSGTPSPEVIVEAVRRTDGVLLTGGDDVQTGLYAPDLSPQLKKTVSQADPARDLAELLVIDQVFRQRKPLFAICRGHQILNVAMGGDLIVDIPSQMETPINHTRLDMKDKVVHDVTLSRGSLIHQIFARETLGVNSSHHQAIATIAPPFRSTAWSADGVVEALELNLADAQLLPYLLAVQFHPERLFERHQEFLDLFKSFIQACAAGRKTAI